MILSDSLKIKIGLVFLFIVIIVIGIYFFKIKNNLDKYVFSKHDLELIEYFNEIALEGEYYESPRKTIKWGKPMKLFVYKDGENKAQMAIINKTIKKINSLVIDGFNIELTDNIDKSNAILYLCEKEKVAEINPYFFEIINNEIIEEEFSGFGFVNFDWNNFQIVQALIFIEKNESLEIQESTILEELTQSIGLLNDSEKYKNSVFYKNQIEDGKLIKDYSILDKDIIRLLYNSKMKAGLDKKQTEKVIKKIILKQK